jgi:hypothetical protein
METVLIVLLVLFWSVAGAGDILVGAASAITG